MQKLIVFIMPLLAALSAFPQTTATIPKAKQPASTLYRNIGLLMLLALIYLLPIAVALIRRSSKISNIILLNIFWGWAVVGWISALIWAFTSEKVTRSLTTHNKLR